MIELIDPTYGSYTTEICHLWSHSSDPVIAVVHYLISVVVRNGSYQANRP